MITLDMTKKHIDVAITEQSFVLESGILTLQISLGTYDLVGKTITAGFSLTALETGALTITDGVIQLPIYYGLLAFGTNYIQLNIRQGATLEQSPRMVLFVRNGVSTTPPTAEDATLVTYLVNICVTATAAAEAVVADFEDVMGEGHQLQADLQASIATGSPLYDNLTNANVTASGLLNDLTTPSTGAIDLATAIERQLREVTTPVALAAEDDLEADILTAQGLEDDLEADIATAQALHNDLADPTTGSIKQATDAHDLLADPATGSIKLAGDAEGTLEADILAAGVAEASLEQAIADGDLNAIKLYAANIMQQVQALMRVYAQMNIFQEATANAIDYGIISLPKNAANGPGRVVIEGNTSTNLAGNGNFSNGTTGYTPVYGSIAASNNECVYTLTTIGSADQNRLTLMGNAIQNFFGSHIYYLGIEIMPKYSQQLTIGSWSVGLGATMFTTISRSAGTTLAGAYNLVSGRVTANASGGQAEVRYGVASISGSTALNDIYKFRKNQIVNLTLIFGAGNEPDLATCDKLYAAGFFSGTVSVDGTGRIRSLGKNLFDSQLESGSISTVTGALSSDATRIRSKNYTKVRPSTAYIIKDFTNSVSGLYVIEYDKNYNFVTASGAGGITQLAFTTNAITAYVKFRRDSVINLSSLFQIEAGTTATPYEAHRRSELYFNGGMLYSVPATKDTIESDSGALRKIQRVQRYVLQSGDFLQLITSDGDTDRVRTKIFADAYQAQTSKDHFYLANWNRVSLNDVDYIPTYIGYVYQLASKDFEFIVAKGAYANTGAAVTALAGTVIYYQLATLVTTPVPTTGQLITFPSGTVYNEPYKADACIYGSNAATIIDTTRPIAELERLYKLDPLTGSPTELPVSTAVVAANGLTFTHPSAVAGDILAFTYRFAYAAPVPKTTVTYFDSNIVEEDIAVPGTFYKVTHRVNNGTVEHVKTAV